MDTETKRRRPPGSGRRPTGPNGEARDQHIPVKIAPSERAALDDYLRRRGLPIGAVGARALLLALLADDAQDDGEQLAA